MSEIILENSSQEGITMLSNIFIDQYMPRANGEFVKVYIYLLRLLRESRASLDLAKMADTLLCTERDIARALKYWEKEKLMIFHYTSAGKLSGISLTPPKAEQEENVQSSSSPSPRSSQRLTPDRVRELKQNEAIVQLLYIA